MTIDLRRTAADWLAARRTAVVVEVADTAGSAPRDAGTRMLVSAGADAGTIGGGRLECKAVATARDMLRTGELDPHTEHVALGPSLGQCCGGAVTLRYRRLDAEALATWPVSTPLFHLQLYGAGHVGRAIATLLATLDVVVDWIDPRDDAFPPTTTLGSPWPSRIRAVAVDAVEAEVDTAPPGAFYLVLTHDHDLDLRIATAILRRGDFRWFGLIGSKTKRQRFEHRFAQRGFDPALVARMSCPIGIDGIDGKAPEAIALAVVAQLLQVRIAGATPRMPGTDRPPSFGDDQA